MCHWSFNRVFVSSAVQSNVLVITKRFLPPSQKYLRPSLSFIPSNIRPLCSLSSFTAPHTRLVREGHNIAFYYYIWIPAAILFILILAGLFFRNFEWTLDRHMYCWMPTRLWTHIHMHIYKTAFKFSLFSGSSIGAYSFCVQIKFTYSQYKLNS